jgi:hypothetical protein
MVSFFNATIAKLLNNSGCLHPERSEFHEVERTKSKDLSIMQFYRVLWAGKKTLILKILRLRPAVRGSAQDEEFDYFTTVTQ